MLVQVISPVRQRQLGRILKPVARLHFSVMTVAGGTEGLLVAEVAGPALLFRGKPVTFDEISGMVHGRTAVRMTFAAQGRGSHFHGMLNRHARPVGASV